MCVVGGGSHMKSFERQMESERWLQDTKTSAVLASAGGNREGGSGALQQQNSCGVIKAIIWCSKFGARKYGVRALLPAER